MLIVKLNAEQTAAALFIAYFCGHADSRKHFHELMEQVVASNWTED